MQYRNEPGKLKRLGSYLGKAARFYDLKNEQLARIIFIIILFISFGSALIPEAGALSIVGNLAGVTLIFLVSTVYLAAYIKDIRDEEYTIEACFRIVARNAGRIVASSVAYMTAIAVFAGILTSPEIMGFIGIFVFVPVIIIYVMFLFTTCFVVDKDKGIAEAYMASRNITSGYKGGVFLKLLGFNLVVGFPSFFVWTAAAASGKVLAANFIIAFTGAIINLMQQRLIALMYIDLTEEVKVERL